MASQPGITLLGLGPGNPEHLTRQAWQIIQDSTEIYLRTRQHLLVSDFPARLLVQSFDHLYDAGESFNEVYSQIVDKILELGRRPEGVIYAVPGHPLVAEATGAEIIRRAQLEGLPV
jgi:tetrapyrrole methylase family protein/MazG family protein